MALFGFNKKKEEKAENCCCCGESADAPVVNEKLNGEFTSIKVLGAGCKNCHEMYENVKKAVSEMRISVDVEYITDMQKVMAYGVMSVPAIVVNEKVVSMGKVLKTADVEKLLSKLRG
ncbi:MAG: thioredoxin family protein [Ruminococcus flavefaciens]|nr:thioredoxin family protein [Ruminococcus flavefaciens]MCM1058772.1 thioredoxin family protein [Eubacterium sp.]